MASTQRLRLYLLLADNQGETDTTSAYTDSDSDAYSGDAAKCYGSEHDRVNTSEEEVDHMREGCPEEEGTRK